MQARSIATIVAMTKPLIGDILILQDQPQREKAERERKRERGGKIHRGKASRNSPGGK